MSDTSGQSATGGYRPAGWYHAQGDPPGTQRYWDGSAWQSDPQPVNPTGQYAATESPAAEDTTGYSDHRETTGYSDRQSSPAAAAPASAPVTEAATSALDHVTEAATSASDHVTEAATSASDPAVASPDDWSAPPADPSTYPGPSGSSDVGGFLSTLFDTKFTSFITGRAISVVYVLVIVAVALFTLFFIVGGLAGGGATALVALILGPLLGLFYLVMIRLTLEFFVNQFRQTELLEAIAEKLDRDSD